MELRELLEITNEHTNVRVTVDGEFVVAYYDGRNSIDEEFLDCEVNSVEVAIADHTWALKSDRGKPYLSVDVSSKAFVEIWHTDDGDDWAQVNVDKQTGYVTSIMTSDTEYCSTMTYEKAKEVLFVDGFTDFDPLEDRYNSWYEYDYCVSADSPYDYL